LLLVIFENVNFNLILIFQVDPELPVSVRRSLEDSNLSRDQEGVGYSLPREPEGFESSEKIISHILKASSLRSQDPQSGLGRPNPVRPILRPGSGNGHDVPSIVMLTSVDHADGTKYTLNPMLSVFALGSCKVTAHICVRAPIPAMYHSAAFYETNVGTFYGNRCPDENRCFYLIGVCPASNSDQLYFNVCRCRQLGVQVHISKPVKRVVLVRALHLALGISDSKPVPQVGVGIFFTFNLIIFGGWLMMVL
jgi:hypothetical protein